VKTRKPLAILAATAVAGLGLTALATPASADTTINIGGPWALDGDTYKEQEGAVLGPSSLFSIPAPTFAGTSITISVAAGTTFNQASGTIGVSSDGLSSAQGLVCSGEDCTVNVGESAEFTILPSASNSRVELLVDDGGAGGGLYREPGGTNPLFYVNYQAPAATTGGPAPAPATVDVTLDQITSEVLRTWASTATLGSWKQLPESSEIIGVDENAGKTFLGAATTPDFPVNIAQRQVDNGWGAYETFNEDGDLTSVFIPAGGWMAITNSTRLYAIWSD